MSKLRYLYTIQRCSVREQLPSTRFWLIASHIGWILSWYQAYVFGDQWLMFMALATIIFSSFYHYTGSILAEVIDTTFALLYLLLGPWLLWQSEATLREWGVGVMVVFASLAIYLIASLRRRQNICDSYVGWHTLWHLTAALLTSCIYGIYFGQIAF